MEESSKTSKIRKIFDCILIFVVIILLILGKSIFYMNIGELKYYEIISISILLGIHLYITVDIIFEILTDILDI